MVSAQVKVINETGLHARPANQFVKEAVSHRGCSVSIRKGGRSFNGKSIVSVLSACVKCGDEIEIVADGEGEEQALAELVAAVGSGLGE